MMAKKYSAFTLIEIIVVVAIIGIILPALFAVIFTLLRLNLQLSYLQRIKESGDYASNQMINLVRNNALNISGTCQSGQPYSNALSGLDSDQYIFFEDKYGHCFGYFVKDNSLASASANFSLPDFTDGRILLIDSNETGQDFAPSVSDAVFEVVSSKLARITFTVEYDPKPAYLQTQSLRYQYNIYIRD